MLKMISGLLTRLTKTRQLATPGNLAEADWREIYYSLDSKWRDIADDDDVDEPKIAEQWRQHIRTIMAKIGPDGQDMVRNGDGEARERRKKE